MVVANMTDVTVVANVIGGVKTGTEWRRRRRANFVWNSFGVCECVPTNVTLVWINCQRKICWQNIQPALVVRFYMANEIKTNIVRAELIL